MSIKYAILGLLHYREMYGYQIKDHIAKYFSTMWTVSLAQIYASLKSLAEEGLIVLSDVVASPAGAPSKKLYSITYKGRQEFQHWLKNYDGDNMTHRDPFMLRFVFFGFGEEEDALGFVEKEIRRNEKQRDVRLEALPRRKTQGMYVSKAAELGLKRREMYLDWLNEVREILINTISERSPSVKKDNSGPAD